MLPLFYPSILITLMFFFSGFEKILFFSRTTTKFAKKMGLSLIIAQLVICAVILLELAAPTAIAAYLFTGLVSFLPLYKLAILGLIAFTLLATVLYHNPLKGRDTYYAFMSKLSTIGGLLALYFC